MKALIFAGVLAVCVSAQKSDNTAGIPGLPNPAEKIKDTVNAIKGEETDNGIERPCESFDMYCIRRYLAEHSYCKPIYGPVPEPLYRVQATQHLTRVNLTITETNLTYRGLNGRIEEFFINRRTDQVVLAVEFRNLDIYSKNAFFFFYRRAKEPVITRDFFKVSFSSVVVTATIPGVHHVRFDRSENFGFSNDITAKFVVGPNAFKSKDPVVKDTLLQLALNMPINTNEYLLTESQFFMATFVQHTLCDFGLKLI